MGGKIDTTLFRVVDITGDGINDTVSLSIEASNINSPFNWTLKVISNNRVLYSYIEKDGQTDSRFTVDSQTQQEYINLNKKFFFKQFAELEVTKKVRFGPKNFISNSDCVQDMRETIIRQLIEHCGLTKIQAEKMSDRITQKVKLGKVPILMHAIGMDTSLPMIYVKECETLIPIYTD